MIILLLLLASNLDGQAPMKSLTIPGHLTKPRIYWSDLNQDGRVSADDIDLIAAAIRSNEFDPAFDLNEDQELSFDDLCIVSFRQTRRTSAPCPPLAFHRFATRHFFRWLSNNSKAATCRARLRRNSRSFELRLDIQRDLPC